MERLCAGPSADDLSAGLALVALLRSEYLASGTDGTQQLLDAEVIELQRAARVVLKRLGVQLDVPWRGHSGFKTYWVANDGRNSWQARRNMVADVFDPVQDQLDSLGDQQATGGSDLVEPATEHTQLGWPKVDVELEHLRTAFRRARSELEYREVGLACVGVLETLSAVAYDDAAHGASGEAEPPVANTRDRLGAVAEQVEGKELRKLVRAAIELSQALKHSTTRTRTEAGIAADTVLLVAHMVRRLTRPD